MPALITQLQWNVGSDDFVLPALVAVVVRVVCIGAVIGVLIYLFVGPEGCSDPAGVAETVPPLLYGSLFAFVFIQLLAVIVENIIFSISAKGSIYDSEHEKKRQWLPFWLFIRVLLFLIEIEVVIVCAVAVFGPAPYAAGALMCPEYHDGPLVFAKVAVITLFVLLAIYATGFAIFLDPLGVCHAPVIIEKLKELIENGKKDENEEVDFEAAGKKNEEHGFEAGHQNQSADNNSSDSSRGRLLGLGRFLGKAKRALCCLNTGGKRSKTSAFREVALALYTLFSDTDDVEKRLVPSDILAGMILLSQNHDRVKKVPECTSAVEGCICRRCSRKEFRRSIRSKCKTRKWTPKKLAHFNQSKKELFDNLVHYMSYSMGMYGWTLHVFDNLCCGFCQLCTVTCCVCNYKCRHKRDGEDFHSDGLCMSGIGTIRLHSHLIEDDIVHANYENDETCKVPFSICIDKPKEAIVISVRGTLSLKDALTDMSACMEKVEKEYCIEQVPADEQYIHKGMHRSAKRILKKLNELKSSMYNIVSFDDLMKHSEFSEYKLVVTGHSLGAGVASVLAFLLYQSKDYKDRIICYAFSPPGCVFSLPLMDFSKNFTTSVILGNDMVPRISFPSLIFLKHQLLYLLKECKKPKAQVIFQPGWVDKYIPKKLRECFCGPHVDPDLDRKKIIKDISDAEPAVKKPQYVGYPPGSILHIKIDRQAKPLCLGYFYPNKLSVEPIDNEDLCMLEIDRGMFDDHLPTAVLSALKRCQRDDNIVPEGRMDAWRELLQSEDRDDHAAPVIVHLETVV